MTLNEQVLAAVGQYAPANRWVRGFILALDERTLRVYLEQVHFETGRILNAVPGRRTAHVGNPTDAAL